MNKVIVITGPTGIGKSSILKNLSENLPIEIINADSRQIYQDLYIGTASPSEEEKSKFKHHLYNFLAIDKTYSSGQYIKDTKKKITEIHNQGKIPIIIGGTFFYIKSLWDGLAMDVNISNEIKQLVENMTSSETRQELKTVDIISYEKIHPHDSYRNKRALTVSLATSQPFSQLPLKGGVYNDYMFESFYLDIDREILYDKINKRVAKMFDAGLLDEIFDLIFGGCMVSATAFNSIGYKEILTEITFETKKVEEILEKLEEIKTSTEIRTQLIELISKNTRNYAKRQLTWFRNEKRLKRFDRLDLIYYLSDKLREL